MSDRAKKRETGFSLLELTISMALGTLVLGAAVQLYTQGVSATWTVSQRAELQQDFRAASNVLINDLGMAGAGLPQGTPIQLPTSSTLPRFGCAQASGNPCYLGSTNTAGVNYPVQGTTPYLYGLLPGYIDGPTLPSGPAATDTVSVVYTDNSFFLDCYDAKVASTTTVTFVADTASSNCTANGATVQSITDPAVGLTAGDLVLFTFGSTYVVGEVTTTATTTTVAFASADALQMNQAAASTDSLASQYVASPPAAALTKGFGTRLFVITYYIDNTQTVPRLMRQVSGHLPMPVAENVAYMKFTYDLYNNSTNTTIVQQANPGATGTASAGMLPSQITKINIQNMAMDSALKGGQYGITRGYQGINFQTSVSARNMSYVNNYVLGGS